MHSLCTPHGHGDGCKPSGFKAGCVDLLNTIKTRVQPSVCVFGHIHEGYGCTVESLPQGMKIKKETQNSEGNVGKARQPYNSKLILGDNDVEEGNCGSNIEVEDSKAKLGEDGSHLQTSPACLCINASTCTFNYKPTNPPVIFELPIR